MLVTSTYQTPFGSMVIEHDEHYVYKASFLLAPEQSYSWQGKMGQYIATQIQHYCNNPHHRFQLPLKPAGSSFQQQVWNALRVIPVGRTLTYGELALQLQTSPRAVGQACKTNPIALFIPCHRIIAKTHLGGYMGLKEALPLKNTLLNHEGFC